MSDTMDEPIETEVTEVMEVDQPPITLEVLRVIKESQAQHGLKHGDYHRYRGYCKRKIERLRKSVTFHLATSGKKSQFQLRKITHDTITGAHLYKKDPVRYLLILLYSAERSWSYAMALKEEAGKEPRKKFHLRRRLDKAVLYSKLLSQLVTSVDICDPRTKLEGEAYYCFMKGSYLFEQSKWISSGKSLKKSQAIYSQLSQAIGDEDIAMYYQQKEKELTPTIKYCTFQMDIDGSKRGSADMSMSELSMSMSGTMGDLLNQTKMHQDSLSEVTWIGRSMQIKNEKTRSLLTQFNGPDTLTFDQLDNLLFECRECIQSVRDKENGDKSPLHSYLQYVRHQLTIRKHLLLIVSLTSCNEKIRPYETIIGSYEDIKELPLDQHFNKGDVVEFIEDIDGNITAYRSFKCYNIAKSGKIGWKESVALLHRAVTYADTAIKGSPSLPPSLVTELKDITLRANQEMYTIYANGIVDQDASEDKNKLLAKPLIDRLDVYVEDGSIAQGKAIMAKELPDFKPIPCKPLFFDLALNHIEMPNLDEEINAGSKGGITGLVKSLWWGK